MDTLWPWVKWDGLQDMIFWAIWLCFLGYLIVRFIEGRKGK